MKKQIVCAVLVAMLGVVSSSYGQVRPCPPGTKPFTIPPPSKPITICIPIR